MSARDVRNPSDPDGATLTVGNMPFTVYAYACERYPKEHGALPYGLRLRNRESGCLYLPDGQLNPSYVRALEPVGEPDAQGGVRVRPDMARLAGPPGESAAAWSPVCVLCGADVRRYPVS